MPSITIKFRAKRDDFAGGKGYKIPKLTASHITTERDTYGVTFLGGLTNTDITIARLRKLTGTYWPGVVFESNPENWTITPVGKGFMADLSLTISR